MEFIDRCLHCKFIMEAYEGFQCLKCGECLEDVRPHEHDKNDKCIDDKDFSVAQLLEIQRLENEMDDDY